MYRKIIARVVFTKVSKRFISESLMGVSGNIPKEFSTKLLAASKNVMEYRNFFSENFYANS